MEDGVVERYRRMLAAGRGGSLESAGGGGQPDLSAGGRKERVDTARAELHRIVRQHLGDAADLHRIADRIAARGREALGALADRDEARLVAAPRLLEGLEAIVRTEGRPSFLVRNGEVDRSTSPLGNWGDTLDVSADLLRDALACVGRIDLAGAPQGFAGTGFLVHEDAILTNRHVLQAVATGEHDGSWRIKPGAAIDFGHEYQAAESVGRRALERVVFAGSKPIVSIDHTRLDLALIGLAPAPTDARPRRVLAVDRSPGWAQEDQTLFTIGYPARPRPGDYKLTLLEKLFHGTFGCKRLAPGLVMPAQPQLPAWTAAHDATTLGGNSGSAVLAIGHERAAAGLHYGGRRGPMAENWGHVLGSVLAETDGRSSTTLEQRLVELGVELVGRPG
jgi:hypothetical protein